MSGTLPEEISIYFTVTLVLYVFFVPSCIFKVIMILVVPFFFPDILPEELTVAIWGFFVLYEIFIWLFLFVNLLTIENSVGTDIFISFSFPRDNVKDSETLIFDNEGLDDVHT